MCELSAAIKDHNFYLMASLQKVCDFTKFNIHIVFADLQPKPHLFQVKRLGITLIALQLFGALVIVLAPVDNFYNRRASVWRYFNQVQLPIYSCL